MSIPKVRCYVPGTYTTSVPSLLVLAMRLLRIVRLRMSVALIVRRVVPSVTLTILRPLLPLAWMPAEWRLLVRRSEPSRLAETILPPSARVSVPPLVRL